MIHFDTVPACDRRTEGQTDGRIYSVAVLGWGQGGTGSPPNLAQAPPQIFDWFRSAFFLLEGF